MVSKTVDFKKIGKGQTKKNPKKVGGKKFRKSQKRSGKKDGEKVW